MPIAEILIVADDKQTVKSLKASLVKLGYDVCGITNNTTEAIQLTLSLKPDLILIDTKLNEFEDGVETARLIKGKHNVPHVFISKDTDEKTIEKSKTTNPYGFLLKPVDTRDLNACLRLALYRFKTEKKLQEGEERYHELAENATKQWEEYKLIFEAIPAMVIVKDCDNKIIRINKKAAEFIGHPIGKMEGKQIEEFFPAEADKYLREDRQVISSGKPVYNIIEEYKGKTGEVFVIKYDKFPYNDLKGKITGIIVMAQDITHEKIVERKLLEAEQRNSVLINIMPDLLFEYDKEGRHLDYRAANPEYLFNDPTSFIGKSVLETFPVGIGAMFAECIKKSYDTNSTQLYEYCLNINGSEKDYEARFLKSGEDRVLAIIRDITSKKTDEKILKQSLNEKEILLKEIHHRVKNNLQIVSSLLKLQSKYVTDKKAIQLLKESQNRVQSMSLIHQKLYQTRNFSHIDFQEYILTVTMHLQHSFGILADRVKVNIDVRDIIMSIDNAIPAGLIINELVSNSLKYAFPNGRKGEINILAATDEITGDYWLSVRDNGTGLPEDLAVRNAETFGLNLVNILVGQMGGTLEVINWGGTEFRINFKISDYIILA